MITVDNWLEYVKGRHPNADVDGGPLQEAPRCGGFIIRVWQSGHTTFYEKGQAEKEWTIMVYISTRGEQYLGQRYADVADIAVDLLMNVDRTAWSITQARYEIVPLPEGGYLTAGVVFTENAEVPF